MHDKRFADCRAEFAKLENNLAGYVRLDSQQTSNMHLRFRRQQRSEGGGSFFCEGSLFFFCQIMAHHFEYAICIAVTWRPNAVARVRFGLRNKPRRNHEHETELTILVLLAFPLSL